MRVLEFPEDESKPSIIPGKEVNLAYTDFGIKINLYEDQEVSVKFSFGDREGDDLTMLFEKNKIVFYQGENMILNTNMQFIKQVIDSIEEEARASVIAMRISDTDQDNSVCVWNILFKNIANSALSVRIGLTDKGRFMFLQVETLNSSQDLIPLDNVFFDPSTGVLKRHRVDYSEIISTIIDVNQRILDRVTLPPNKN